MSLQNIRCWYGTAAQAIDLSEQVADQITISPKPSVDTAIYGGSSVPANIPVGLSYMVTCSGAFYAATLDVIDPDAEDGWLAVVDPVADVGLVTPAALINKPVNIGVWDPAQTIRFSLVFEPPETAGRAYNVAPGINGTTRFVFTANSGVAQSTVASTATSVSETANSLTVISAIGE